MNRKLLRFLSALALVFICGAWARAQEDEIPARKSALSKAEQEARAKAREKRVQAKAKANAEALAKAVDINRATKEELMKSLGLVPEAADSVIAKRPYKTKEDLVSKGALPAAAYHNLRKRVAVK
jgi:DNA uptake protein ComE-like DNA-binding protein